MSPAVWRLNVLQRRPNPKPEEHRPPLTREEEQAYAALLPILARGGTLTPEQGKLILKRTLNLCYQIRYLERELLWKDFPPGHPRCEAEDQGGWQECPNPATWSTKREPKAHYCDEHRINRHCWREDETEPFFEP